MTLCYDNGLPTLPAGGLGTVGRPVLIEGILKQGVELADNEYDQVPIPQPMIRTRTTKT